MPLAIDKQRDDGTEMIAHHASKSLLAGGVPQLQTDFEAIYIHFLRNKKSPAGGGGVLWIELVLGIALEQTSLTHTWGAVRTRAAEQGEKNLSCP